MEATIHQPAGPATWEVPEKRAARADFWHVYDACYDELQGRMTEALADHPVFGPMLRSMSPEMLAEQQSQSRIRMRLALTGDGVADYLKNLREQGRIYAQMQVPLADWYSVLRMVQHLLLPRMVQAFGGDSDRLSAALLASAEFFDLGMATLAESYLEEKERLLAEQHVLAAELAEQSRRVQEGSRLKSEFLANMSHELRTPLNAIIGFASLLHEGNVPRDAPEFQDFLADILTSGKHLLELVNDVLDLAKVEAGKLDFHPQPVVLREVVGSVAHVLRGKAAEKRIEMTTVVAPDLDDIVLDGARLAQVLYNYVSNALKFTGPDGRIQIRALAEGPDAFRIEVEDTGIGIPQDDMRRLFTEFEQLDAGTARHHGGTGLGLALTRRLVEAQGGSVGVRSAVGQGSVFHAVLPRRHEVGQQQPLMRAVPAPRPDAPAVLVIEDDANDQARLVHILAEAGWAVHTAATAAEAVQRCAEKRFDAVTLDLLLPDGSGMEVLAAIRRSGHNRETPVVVVSVVPNQGGVRAFAVHDWLPKPIDADALLEALRRVLPRKVQTGSVLVIDDDPISLRLMEATLGQLGYTALCRQQARVALQDALGGEIDAIVLDLLMPGMDGHEFLEQLRGTPAWGRVPVLVWTSKDLTQAERARLAAAAQSVVTKGNGAVLVDELRRVLAVEACDGASPDRR